MIALLMLGQITATLPVTCNPTNSICERATAVVNPDGSPIGAGGGGAATPTGSAGSPNASVVSVQGVSGGTAQNVTVTNTPTVNLGTIAGVSTETTQMAVSAKLPASLGAKTGATVRCFTSQSVTVSILGAVVAPLTTAATGVQVQVFAVPTTG